MKNSKFDQKKKREALCEQKLYTNEHFLFVTTEWKKAVKFNHTMK
jgi:hypothetical protein